jgi:hypothetical protein
MKLRHSIALCIPMVGACVMAADLALKFEIPQLNVAAYHRPYVAVWLERTDQKVVTQLAVLYDVRKKDNGGTKYLKDMRQWWRKGGEALELPLDGISGATRGPGEHTISFPRAKAMLETLPPGDYQVVVEAAREAGGRELVRIPFHWPVQSSQPAAVRGLEELGSVSVQLKS